MQAWSFTENAIFFGKLGADNLLLMAVGVLHLIIWWMMRNRGYHRIRAELYRGIYFIGWGFLHDLYRYKAIRIYFLYNRSFVLFQIVTLFVFLLPVYIQLIGDIKRLFKQRTL